MIDTWCESQRLYYLNSPTTHAACIYAGFLALIHIRLGHSSLSKFQKMVPHIHLIDPQLLAWRTLKHPNKGVTSHIELVHVDVSTSSCTHSSLNFCYLNLLMIFVITLRYFLSKNDKSYSPCFGNFVFKFKSNLMLLFIFNEVRMQNNIFPHHSLHDKTRDLLLIITCVHTSTKWGGWT